MHDLWWAASDRFHDTKDDIEAWLFDGKKALRGIAACRIVLGVAILLLLVGNFSTRQLWIGPASIWAEPVRAASNFPELSILDGASGAIVTLVYAFVLLSSLAFTLGWHSRLANIFTLVGFIAIVGQDPTVGDQADNVIRLMLLWFLLLDSSRHWSLDSRRRTRETTSSIDASSLRAAWNGAEMAPRWLSTSLHNIALAGLAAQTILIYMSAGLSKIAEPAWRHGTALYSTMQLPDYRPFPFLSDLFSHSRVLLALVTYAILFAQLFFGVFLLNKTSRALIIALAIIVNIFFAVLMALPVSSLAVIAATGIFISDSTYQTTAEYLSDRFAPAGYWLADRLDDVRDRLDDIRAR